MSRIMIVMTKTQHGQVIIWVLLILVVGLTIGLSIASRTLSGIKGSSEIEEANRAFSAAEAGIEQALYDLETTGSASSVTAPVSLFQSGSSYTYDVTEEGSEQTVIIDAPLKKDEVYQVDATNMSGNIAIYWVNSDSAQEKNDRASLHITLVSKEAADTYAVETYAYNPSSKTSLDNGFSASLGGSGVITIGEIDFSEWTEELVIPGTTSASSPIPKVIRIRAMYNSLSANTIAVKAVTDIFPTQYYTITATGMYEDIERSIQVTRKIPSLPDFFDYTFSDLSTGGLSK